MTQNNLANAYYSRIRGERAENLERAIAYYELALQVLTREQFPEQWATTQNNLGEAYRNRIRGERAENLEEAIRRYELALQVRTREAFPVEWATTQNNLANAYAQRIRGERAENLERAIAHYELALQVYTREVFPTDWAMTQNNLANSYSDRIRGERAENLERAIAHYELALQVRTREQFPEQWATTQNNLATAYLDRIRGERAENLERAIEHYELALQVYTRAAFPERWATTQNNLAAAYQNRIRGERAENLERAIAHYELALQVYTREAFPVEWAMTQNNLASTYSDRIRGERAENLERAIEHYELALQVLTREQFPHEHRQTARNLGDAHSSRGDWDAARAAYALAIQTAEQLFRSAVDPTTQRAEAEELADLYDRDIRACVALDDQRRKTNDQRRMTNDERRKPSSFVIHPSSFVFRPSSDALVAAEAARSRAFLKQLGLREVTPPAEIPPALIAREQAIIEQLRQIEVGLADVHPRADRADERERTLVAQRGSLVRELDEVLEAMLQTPSPASGGGQGGGAARDYVALRRGETPTWDDLRELAERIGKDAALVEFHTFDDQIVAMVWRAGWDAPQLVTLPIDRARLYYRYLLPYEQEVLNHEQHIRAGRAIYNDWLTLGEELLAPLVARRSNGTSLLGDASLVYFIPHSNLHLVPLHALTVRGKPFIAERAVAYAPSAAVLARALTTDDERPPTAFNGHRSAVSRW